VLSSGFICGYLVEVQKRLRVKSFGASLSIFSSPEPIDIGCISSDSLSTDSHHSFTSLARSNSQFRKTEESSFEFKDFYAKSLTLAFFIATTG
jgi:hypothetical protein